MTWSTHAPLGSDHLPITISFSSHASLSPRKTRSFTNFCKADWDGFTAETEKNFADTPCWGKSLQAYPRRRPEDTIPCGYVKDYCDPLPEVVRHLISERDQRCTDDPIDPAIKLLERDIQRHIRQEAQDQWRSLLESSDLATNPKHYWSLLANWAARGRTTHLISQSPSMEKHSSPKAIAIAFNRQYSDCSAKQDWAIRRLLKNLPLTGRLTRERLQQPLGRWAFPLHRGLMGSPCSTSAI